ncbi:hypothetical protein R6242_19370 [Iodobacter sp. CM08]|uniref:hypothetical protein n=1 Tax=Iodobacter sp. CM08 TaxID=3085902 RepID=UPI002980B376|nr:hypothetical protein [Iodobacter sp. CM08]MDW5418732.1 hypothetical protein [Iodobacter sp. CM08]
MTMKKRLALPRDALLCSPELDKVASYFEKNSDQLHGLFSGFLLSMVIEGLKSKEILEMVESDDLSSVISAANQADMNIVVQRYSFRRTHGVTTAASLERNKPERTLVKQRSTGAKLATAPRLDGEKNLQAESHQSTAWSNAAVGAPAPALALATAPTPAPESAPVSMQEQRVNQAPAPEFAQVFSSVIEENLGANHHGGLESASVEKTEQIEEVGVNEVPTNDPLPGQVAKSEMNEVPSKTEGEDVAENSKTQKTSLQYEGYRLKF